MKIIIIGAGISGLALALACERAHISYKLIEKTKQLQHIGGGIIIWPHGMRYLEWLNIADCLLPYLLDVKGCNVIDRNGKLIFNENFSHLNDLLNGQVRPIDRSHLQQALLSALPPNAITYNKTCQSIHHEKNRSRVVFTDGSEETGDLIVGADGIHSSVRTSFNPEVNLHYTQHCWWGGIIEQQDAPSFAPDHVYFGVARGKICIVWPTANNRFMWYLPAKMSLNEFQTATLPSLCADWNNKAIQEIIHAPTKQSFQLPIYEVPPLKKIIHKRCVLIGDAAHGIGPILGQGASLAIEDVYLLMQCLKNNNDIHATLAHYESIRIPRYRPLFELENLSAATMINDNDEQLTLFEQQMRHITLVDMYQELIPLINAQASHQLSKQCKQEIIAA